MQQPTLLEHDAHPGPEVAPGPLRVLAQHPVAERIDELPLCWAAFEDGRLTEDAMVLLARRLPARRDAELARLARVADTALSADRTIRPRPVGSGTFADRIVIALPVST